MSEKREDDVNGPDGLDLLLPWHVNRTLPAPEEEALVAALRADARLRASLAVASEDDAAIKESAALLGAPGAAVLDKVLARTGTARQAAPQVRNVFSSVLAALAPRRMAFAVAALALLAIVKAGVITWLSSGPQPAGGPSLASDGDTVSAIAMVRPARGVTAAQFAEALSALELRVADGPTAEGYFLLRPADGPDADAPALIGMLRSRTDVFEAVIPMEE